MGKMVNGWANSPGRQLSVSKTKFFLKGDTMKDKVAKFESAVRFESLIHSFNLNYINIMDLRKIEGSAQELHIAITNFDLDLYKHDTEMIIFIFETWEHEASIAVTASRKVLINMEEYL